MLSRLCYERASAIPEASFTRDRRMPPKMKSRMIDETPMRCEPKARVNSPIISGPRNAVTLPEKEKKP